MNKYKENGAVFNCAVFEERLKELGVDIGVLSINVCKVTSSTNDDAELYAREKCDTPYALFVADEQTGGKGRLGRSFYSKEGGLYMSLLIKGPLPPAFALELTSLSGVALCQAIEHLSPLSPKIKWVNDVYLNGRKAAGILAKGRLAANNDEPRLEYAVVGIGVNVETTAFPSELKDSAISLCELTERPPSREMLCAEIISTLLSLLDKIGSVYIAEEYRKRSFLDGKRVRIIEGDTEYTATVLGITDKCELIVDKDGKTEILNSAEVTVRF